MNDESMFLERAEMIAEQARILIREAKRAPDAIMPGWKPPPPPTDEQLAAWAERREASNVGLRRHQLRELTERANGLCYLCRLPLDGKRHVEHIIPLSRGGIHSIENLALAHPGCNLTKGTRFVSLDVTTRKAHYYG